MSQEKTLQIPETPFVNEMKLTAGNWLITLAILGAVLLGTPRVWKRIERFESRASHKPRGLLRNTFKKTPS